jgi:hypothetical protein
VEADATKRMVVSDFFEMTICQLIEFAGFGIVLVGGVLKNQKNLAHITPFSEEQIQINLFHRIKTSPFFIE